LQNKQNLLNISYQNPEILFISYTKQQPHCTPAALNIMAEVAYPLPSSFSLPLDGPTYEPDPSLPVSAPNSSTVAVKEDFDASKHLTFEMPEVVMMEDLGYTKDAGVSPVAVSKPFQLFSHEAVMQMRQEVFDVRDNHPEHVFKSNIAVCQVRGYAPK
jgi:hypothetical protein